MTSPARAIVPACVMLLVLTGVSRADDPARAKGRGKPADDPFASLKPPPDDVTRDDGKPFTSFTYTPEQAVETFRKRVEADPNDYVSYSLLGQIYERQAREQGDITGYERAEEAYRKALEIRPDHLRSQVGLAGVLCDRHKFGEGLQLARSILDENPDLHEALAILGDACLELGRYSDAERAYADLLRRSPLHSSLARVAHLAELKGQVDEAIKTLTRAQADARRQGEPAAGVAWYDVRLGDLHFGVGRLDRAEAHYKAVPQGIDPYHDATFGLGRVAEARGRLDEALALYQRAVAIGPDIRMLSALGDLLAELGREAEAEAAYSRLENEAGARPEYARSLAIFLADHDRKLPEALRLAEEDIATRKDVYGYDTLAWALLKNDRPREAAEAIGQALRIGTRDARLHFHAGVIYHRLGRADLARRHLRLALELNPHASRRDAAEARALLAEPDRVGASPAPR